MTCDVDSASDGLCSTFFVAQRPGNKRVFYASTRASPPPRHHEAKSISEMQKRIRISTMNAVNVPSPTLLHAPGCNLVNDSKGPEVRRQLAGRDQTRQLPSFATRLSECRRPRTASNWQANTNFSSPLITFSEFLPSFVVSVFDIIPSLGIHNSIIFWLSRDTATAVLPANHRLALVLELIKAE